MQKLDAQYSKLEVGSEEAAKFQTQKQLAEKIGITQQHVDRYEKGHPIPLEKVVDISTLLGVQKWDLLPNEFQMNDNQSVNNDLFEYILNSIDRIFIEKRLKLPLKQKIRLIHLLYLKIMTEQPSNDNKDVRIDKIIRKFINEQSA